MRWAGRDPGLRGEMGQQDDHGDDGAPASVTVVAADPTEAPAEEDESAESSSAATVAVPVEETPRRGPAIPIKLLILVTVLNLGLALALFAIRPPWRVERAAAPTALPPQVAALTSQVEQGQHGTPYQLGLT